MTMTATATLTHHHFYTPRRTGGSKRQRACEFYVPGWPLEPATATCAACLDIADIADAAATPAGTLKATNAVKVTTDSYGTFWHPVSDNLVLVLAENGGPVYYPTKELAFAADAPTYDTSQPDGGLPPNATICWW